MNRVQGRTAIVISAGRGIGRGCARLLAEEGAAVYLTERDDGPGKEGAAEIRDAGGDAARERIDVLVSNAGLCVIAPLEESTLECAREIVETNVYGVFLGLKHLAPVMAMTRDVAIEDAKRGVRVNSVHPGYIRTRMVAHGADKVGRTIDGLGEDFPMERIGEPADVAWGVLYLARDESRWVTGTQLCIDGGVTAS
ncbi:MAG TPA: SDR family oxidoreductase [Gemmatimonadaceae bacterium]|nr:SDR family oxidoreductase [Gemmatimonadaceae bacterium]